MGKVISFSKHGTMSGENRPPAKTQFPTPDSQQPIQNVEVDYISSLQPLVDEAKRLSQVYDIGAKDVLTDTLCLLIEDAILEECAKAGSNSGPDNVG